MDKYRANLLMHKDGNRGAQHIESKLMLNANLTYSPSKLVFLFVSAKSLFNKDSGKYYKTDQIGTSVLAVLF